MKYLIASVLSVVALVSLADGPRPWRLTIGPAWRARVKSSISAQANGLTPSHTLTYDKDITGHGTWSVGEVEKVQDPDYPTDPTFEKYAAPRTATQTTVTPTGTTLLENSSTDRPLGLKANLGYDFYSAERFSVELNMKFAAYWNMRSTASGVVGGGTRVVRQTTDYYLFSSGPIPDDTDFTSCYPDADPYLPYRQEGAPTSTVVPGNFMSARIRSDLYQIGLGPLATWHILPWLDAYGRAEALCNLAHMSLDSGSLSRSDTKCLLGFGGALGLSAFFTDNIGIYGEAGYEWIDKAETDIRNAKADVDYSSLVLSAGLIYFF